ncbi:hypothetical protein XA68_13206 [Ophiocordyceps unilateralis]|uniref:Secreted protein n=1 Tax=Ophiocordyceps unilateralis TaxID=268505 RepID=A0A2A9PD44_OPHUN|nr:hypothetical protein XA68_13206 [Ophiocordyceps unilateralis]
MVKSWCNPALLALLCSQQGHAAVLGRKHKRLTENSHTNSHRPKTFRNPGSPSSRCTDDQSHQEGIDETSEGPTSKLFGQD